ncbi:MAG: 3-phosphoshikimate 1-carboxyvinyltransferase [Zetaproteobacteria bacterium]|nr:MAG: 3-phosphoshikimate 1-carboxyvinyltransferase [Zetaproteobacteria bacterium]
MNDTLIAGPADRPLSGRVRVPGDKSMSHRAVMLAAMAEGETRIEGFLSGADNLATVRIFGQMGVEVLWNNAERTSLTVCGVGLNGLREPEDVLNAGNAGTCARLMVGVLAGQPFHSVLVGDASLHRRPMARVADPVRRMGADIDGRDGGNKLPLAIRGGALRGIDFEPKVASAQVKSCVLLAGLFAEGTTRVREPRPTRDHTERMLPLFGQPVEKEYGWISLKPEERLQAPDTPVEIPADPSSAAFFAVAASMVPDSCVTLQRVGVNERRTGWCRVLQAMGGELHMKPIGEVGGEPVADLEARGVRLHGVEVAPRDVPDTIDEFPLLFAAAAVAEGEFVLEGAEELRVKESDRIAVMARALHAAGARVEERPDGVRIRGGRLCGGCTVDACGDHRVAMAMAVAAQSAAEPIRIEHAAAIDTSFPGFVSLARELGMNVRWA